MADKLGVDINTIKQRLFRAAIKPVSTDALYEASAFEAIKDAKMGRPRKQPETKAKPAKKTKK